ncbi:60S ribosomal protein L39 [Ascochyta clinopodiicola]|nr:60S ribosomal protein L39 [Ascochyta clinopodiicola]
MIASPVIDPLGLARLLVRPRSESSGALALSEKSKHSTQTLSTSDCLVNQPRCRYAAALPRWPTLRSTSSNNFVQSQKSFRTKQKLAKAQKQNRPIPQWIRLRTNNTIRYADLSNTHTRTTTAVARTTFSDDTAAANSLSQVQRQEEALAQDSSRYLDDSPTYPHFRSSVSPFKYTSAYTTNLRTSAATESDFESQ